MAIYRPPTPRWRIAVVAAVAGLVAGLLIGAFALGQRDADPAAGIRTVRPNILAAAAVLDNLPIEYRESVRDGRVVAAREYRASGDMVASSLTRWRSARAGISVLSPTKARDIDAAFAGLRDLVERRAPADDVARSATELQNLLKGLLE